MGNEVDLRDGTTVPRRIPLTQLNGTMDDPKQNPYLELLMQIVRNYPFSTDDVGVIGTDRIGKLHQLMVEADDTLSKLSPFWDRHIK